MSACWRICPPHRRFILSLRTDDPETHLLPSFALLEMQWILHRVLAMSGAAKFATSDGGVFNVEIYIPVSDEELRSLERMQSVSEHKEDSIGFRDAITSKARQNESK
ncbi:uncharacterized protein BO72DRAFT_253519 [Aspergillus fijiensis CBS 313.89]|uniref:Uncharacterized protein n=1 Tax=Aspergillus fijiensis CBS 313.89 TaxID=1448319 RepID=A0A8G1VV79_9EURO|nr:uncharacterized protein BO72DRAFT_253519 [Aspergillus fijiensis CBS 313.89]RAK72948.1 hypothetical protein BO72DRAFT_253519 [Aspergillus fijiensis CBS 313.89]